MIPPARLAEQVMRGAAFRGASPPSPFRSLTHSVLVEAGSGAMMVVNIVATATSAAPLRGKPRKRLMLRSEQAEARDADAAATRSTVLGVGRERCRHLDRAVRVVDADLGVRSPPF
jgi:hypothetical protein